MPDTRGPLPPFPTPGTLNAPPSWRCIDFISDLHLHEGLPKTTKALSEYLASTTADAVLMLGDIFEAWVGDDMRAQAYETSCINMLATAGKRLHLGMMVGNRDFLLGQDMLAACNAHRLVDPTILQAFKRTVLLVHGDELCLADTGYLQFRTQVRQPAWQAAFLSHPLEARLAQAAQMRSASQMKQQTRQPETWADVDEPCAAKWLQAAGATTLVHGHTHRPADEPFGIPGAHRHVLSDWDMDHEHPRAEVLRLTANGFERLPISLASSA